MPTLSKIGAGPALADTEKGREIMDAYERGAPKAWLMRRYGLSRGEYQDITGDTGSEDNGANSVTGY